MAKATKRTKTPSSERTKRAKLTAAESLKRMEDFSERKERFIATVRKGKNRSLSA